MSLKNKIYGFHPLIEAVRSGKDIEKVLIQKGLRKDTYTGLNHLLKEYGIPFQYVPREKLNRITTKNHQGIIAFLSPVTYQRTEDIVRNIFEQGREPLLLILDQITDVRNFGAIARSAECFGVDAIIIPEKGSARINDDAMKTSAGALNRIAVCRTSNLKEITGYLKNSGIRLFTATEKSDKTLSDIDFRKPGCIIMGSEEKGISGALLEIADESFKIPISGEIESLNVSVAAGICLYEASRQRKK
jgi:23S rRNA (guanosine2251-2'-O)-methyltransferase